MSEPDEEEDDLFSQRRKKASSRADQIFNAFREFHQANPEVWRLFEQLTFSVINRGFKNYAGEAIYQRIRWHAEIETNGGELKLNDHYKAYYTRLFHAAHPEHANFFRHRELTSKDKPASANDRQEFVGPPPRDEDDLTRKLLALLPRT